MDKLQLPTSQIVRLVKEQMSNELSLSSETKKSFNHATSLFILYLASAAKEHCTARKRTTLMGDDVLNAIVDLNLDWDHISGPLSDFVDQYREEKINTKRRRLDTIIEKNNDKEDDMPKIQDDESEDDVEQELSEIHDDVGLDEGEEEEIVISDSE